MYEHIVVFQLDEKVTNEKQQELVDTLLSFKGKIPDVIDITAGINVTEEKDNHHGYNIGLRVTFESKEALRNYGPHPVHQAFVKKLEGIIKNVIVVDYPIVIN